MITYEWKCACDITIKSDSEKQLEKAMLRHYKIHAKANGWGK
jgi:hypothetical protein